MKKYKLIKKYPFSPTLGIVITKTNDWEIAQLYPEYWEEVVEKDYEILSFIVDSNKAILTRRQNGLFACGFFKEIDGCYSEEDILSNDPKRVEWLGTDDEYGYSIHSVKRLSDGVIFTVGDRIKIKSWNESCIILNFKIINNILNFELKDTEATANYNNLSDFIKTILKTDDGIDIYEGDSYSFVSDGLIITSSEATIVSGKRQNWKYFSSKEKAEEYINEKKFSLQDIKNVFGREGLKKIFKKYED